jgi:hypothetical protein
VETADSGIHLLETRILQLEQLQQQQIAELKRAAGNIADSMSPSNMVKNVLKDIAVSPGLRSTAINTAIGIGAGFLGNKLYVGKSKSIFKKVAGSAVQFLIANFVRKKIPEMQENNLQHNHRPEIKES